MYKLNEKTRARVVAIRSWLHKQLSLVAQNVKVIYHPLYGMNNYVLIWGD